MVTIIIFWCAVFAIILYLLSLLCRGIASVVEGGVEAFVETLVIGMMIGAGVLLLYLLWGLINNIIQGTFGELISTMLLYIVVIGVLLFFFGGIGTAFFALITIVGGLVVLGIGIVQHVADGLGTLCEKGYIYFMGVLKKQLERC